jgi:hypothetical protein
MLLLSAAFSALLSLAQAADPTATVLEYGRYSSEIVGFRPAENTSGNLLVRATNQHLIEVTKTIPCKVGEAFGLIVQFDNLPVGREFTILNVMEHPPLKQPDGTVMTRSVQEKKNPPISTPSAKKRYLWYFVRGQEYELVPGEWTRAISIDGKEVLRFTFNVVK